MPTPAETPVGFPADHVLPIPFPSELKPSSLSLHLVQATTRFESPFTRFMQAGLLPGSQFKLVAQFNGLDKRQQRIWRAFIAQMRGTAGRFYWPAVVSTEHEPVVPVTEDTDGGPRLVADIVTTGPRVLDGTGGPNGIVITGLPHANGELVLEAGDFVSYDDYRGHRRLHLVTEDAFAYGSGNARLIVAPEVRSDAPQILYGARIHLDCPSGTFVLEDDVQGAIEETPDGFANVSLSAIEAVPPVLAEVL